MRHGKYNMYFLSRNKFLLLIACSSLGGTCVTKYCKPTKGDIYIQTIIYSGAKVLDAIFHIHHLKVIFGYLRVVGLASMVPVRAPREAGFHLCGQYMSTVLRRPWNLFTFVRLYIHLPFFALGRTCFWFFLRLCFVFSFL